MGMKYGVKYGSNSKNVGFSSNSSISASLGGSSHTLSSSGTTTLSCQNKVCSGNLILNGTTAMSCKDKMMGNNIQIITVVSEASTYAIFTASGTLVVPAGVSSVTVTCVGGGGGSGGNPYAYYWDDDRQVWSNGPTGGGGGGYVVTETFDVTAGESLTVVVGAGGARGTWAGEYGGHGGESYVSRSDTKLCRAIGGARGIRAALSEYIHDHPYADSYGNSVAGYGGSAGGGLYKTGYSSTCTGKKGGTNSMDGPAGYWDGSAGTSVGRGQGNLTSSGTSNGMSVVQPDGTAYAQNTYKYNDATSGVLYGGGGGGGYYTGAAGGDGGGGTGCHNTSTSALDFGGTDGTANTGGGGGGGFGFNASASQFGSHSGGSGVVVIRFN